MFTHSPGLGLGIASIPPCPPGVALGLDPPPVWLPPLAQSAGAVTNDEAPAGSTDGSAAAGTATARIIDAAPAVMTEVAITLAFMCLF
jgi:hypothetical protein